MCKGVRTGRAMMHVGSRRACTQQLAQMCDSARHSFCGVGHWECHPRECHPRASGSGCEGDPCTAAAVTSAFLHTSYARLCVPQLCLGGPSAHTTARWFAHAIASGCCASSPPSLQWPGSAVKQNTAKAAEAPWVCPCTAPQNRTKNEGGGASEGCLP